MALQGPIPVEFGMFFPDGAYIAGPIARHVRFARDLVAQVQRFAAECERLHAVQAELTDGRGVIAMKCGRGGWSCNLRPPLGSLPWHLRKR